jgi:HEPN domain-containing protein
VNRPAGWLKQGERDLGFGETAIATKCYEWAAFCAQQSASEEETGRELVEYARTILEFCRSQIP